MNMNMTIIMHMNIYITAKNEAKLRTVKDSTMSGLINYLLDGYFGHNSGDELAPGAKGGVVLSDIPVIKAKDKFPDTPIIPESTPVKPDFNTIEKEVHREFCLRHHVPLELCTHKH